MYRELNSDSLNTEIENYELVFVQYGATWCGNCKITKPKVKRMAENHENIEFLYVDAEKFPNSRKLANVTNLPTFAAFKNGTLVHELQGNKIEILNEVLDAITNH
jgi:thiol-disulfide isomerase/thioredoxin